MKIEKAICDYCNKELDPKDKNAVEYSGEVRRGQGPRVFATTRATKDFCNFICFVAWLAVKLQVGRVISTSLGGEAYFLDIRPRP